MSEPQDPPVVSPESIEEVNPADLTNSVVLYTGVAVCLFLLYALLRRSRFFYTRVFYPLYPHEELSDYEKRKRKSPIEPPKRWISFLLSSKREEDVLNVAGLDAYVTLRATKLPLYLFGILAVYSFIFLVPIYAVKAGMEEYEFVTRISIASIDEGEGRVFRWIFTTMIFFDAAIIYLVKYEYENFIRVRKKFLAKKSKERYSVVVERVPKKLMSRRSIERYFEVIMGVGSVYSVTLVPHIKLMKSLDKLVAKRDKILMELEIVQLENSRKGTRKQIFSWETNLSEVLAELSVFTYESQSVLERQESFLSDYNVSPRIAALLSSSAFDEIEKHAKRELKGYMTVRKRIGALLNLLSCGLRKSSVIENGDALEMDAEEFYLLKLSILNRLIELLQERASILLQLVDESNKAEIIEDGSEPSFDEYAALLDVSQRRNHLIKDLNPTAMSKVKSFLIKKEEAPSETDILRDKLFQYISMAAIVTFDSISDANTVAILAVDDENDTIRTSFAKKPDDIRAKNFNYSVVYKTYIAFFGFFITVWLISSFAAFISFLGFVTNLENFRGRFDFVDSVIDAGDGILIELSQQITPFLLIIALNLVPPVLLFIHNLTKPISGSELERKFFSAFYIFSVVQLFIFYQSSAAATVALDTITTNPQGVIDILAEAIPNNAVFFMQFIMIKALLALPLELTRFVPIVLGVILRRGVTCKSFEKESNREREVTKVGCLSSPQIPIDPILSKMNANTMLLYTIGISYCLIAPLMSVICLGYAIMFTVVMRNQFIFVYADELRKKDSLGSHFQSIMDTFFIAIFILTATMTGIFSLKQQLGLAFFGIPTLVFIFLVRIYFREAYQKELNGLPLALAKFYDVATNTQTSSRDEDQNNLETVKEVNDEMASLTGDRYHDYRHPSLKVPATMAL